MKPQILLIFMFLLSCKIKPYKIVEVTDIEPNEELYKDFLKSNKKIILEKKDDLISEEIYWDFFHQIPLFNREMLRGFKNQIKNIFYILFAI